MLLPFTVGSLQAGHMSNNEGRFADKGMHSIVECIASTVCHDFRSEINQSRSGRITWLIIPRLMDLLQDSAKRDLREELVEKQRWVPSLGSHGPFPEACFSQENVHSRLRPTGHGDPQCFVKINFSLPDPDFATLAS